MNARHRWIFATTQLLAVAAYFITSVRINAEANIDQPVDDFR